MPKKEGRKTFQCKFVFWLWLREPLMVFLLVTLVENSKLFNFLGRPLWFRVDKSSQRVERILQRPLLGHRRWVAGWYSFVFPGIHDSGFRIQDPKGRLVPLRFLPTWNAAAAAVAASELKAQVLNLFDPQSPAVGHFIFIPFGHT